MIDITQHSLKEKGSTKEDESHAAEGIEYRASDRRIILVERLESITGGCLNGEIVATSNDY